MGTAVALALFHGRISLGALTGRLRYVRVAPDTAVGTVIAALAVSLLCAASRLRGPPTSHPLSRFAKWSEIAYAQRERGRLRAERLRATDERNSVTGFGAVISTLSKPST